MIKIERISGKDILDKAFEIRRKVFVVEQNVAPEEEYDEFEDHSIHYLAMDGENAVGTCRWRFTKNGIKLERFAVLEEGRGLGVGKALMNQCLTDIDKSQHIYLHAQVQVIPFYEGLGFETVGNEFVEAEIWHKKMVYKG